MEGLLAQPFLGADLGGDVAPRDDELATHPARADVEVALETGRAVRSGGDPRPRHRLGDAGVEDPAVQRQHLGVAFGQLQRPAGGAGAGLHVLGVDLDGDDVDDLTGLVPDGPEGDQRVDDRGEDGREPVAPGGQLVLQLPAFEDDGAALGDAGKQRQHAGVEVARCARSQVQHAHHLVTAQGRHPGQGTQAGPGQHRGADVEGRQVRDDEGLPGGGDPADEAGTDRDLDPAADLLLETDRRAAAQRPAFGVEQHEPRGVRAEQVPRAGEQQVEQVVGRGRGGDRLGELQHRLRLPGRLEVARRPGRAPVVLLLERGHDVGGHRSERREAVRAVRADAGPRRRARRGRTPPGPRAVPPRRRAPTASRPRRARSGRRSGRRRRPAACPSRRRGRRPRCRGAPGAAGRRRPAPTSASRWSRGGRPSASRTRAPRGASAPPGSGRGPAAGRPAAPARPAGPAPRGRRTATTRCRRRPGQGRGQRPPRRCRPSARSSSSSAPAVAFRAPPAPVAHRGSTARPLLATRCWRRPQPTHRHPPPQSVRPAPRTGRLDAPTTGGRQCTWSRPRQGPWRTTEHADRTAPEESGPPPTHGSQPVRRRRSNSPRESLRHPYRRGEATLESRLLPAPTVQVTPGRCGGRAW